MTVSRHELTPVTFLERSGAVHGTSLAVVDGDRHFTYMQWRERARRFASALRAQGLRKDDRVAFLAGNSEPLLLAHFAVPMAGGALVAINSRFGADEVEFVVNHSGARFVFCSSELKDQLPRETGFVELGDEFEKLLATGSKEELELWLQSEDDTIAIDYTSGTTGRPKGVMYSHRGAYLNALAMVIENHLDRESVFLWTLPMFHCNGWCFTWALGAVGAKSVSMPRIDPEEIWRRLDQDRITQFNAAPTVLIMLANHPAAHRCVRRVRVCTGGAPPSPTLIRQMSELNIDLVHLYGLTETYGPLTLNVEPPWLISAGLEEQAKFKSRQGVPHVAAGEVKVMDSRGHPVAADGETLGEVVARGNTVMKGYYQQPEATEEAFSGGWFHTGDVGVVHPDGYIDLRDRKKDIIISGGENIGTIEVERAVMSHPAVLECAVIAIPDDYWGEVPKAFVSLKPGQRVTSSELIEHCRAQLAHFKAPKEVEFCELPKTSTGKIQKFLLREKEWSGHERRIN